MCGIWGYVGTDSTVPVSDAWTGLCSLTDRGPDDWGLYLDDRGKVTSDGELPAGDVRVALGNRRLSILDLSAAGNQPMQGGDGRFWIVYNGEVYNYRELREDLRAQGYEFTSDSDTEVILRAYEAYGPECVERFRGMFAFVVYDTETETVFAARDRFGIKPFYYDAGDRRLAFASELTSLLDAGVTTPELDTESVDGFLTLGYVPSPRTILTDVQSLPPGSTLTYDANSGESTIERYWTPEFGGGGPASEARVRELLQESVDLRLRSDVPVGAFLSGGLDSSTVVALMRRAAEPNRGDLHTFSIGFDRAEYTETDFAETVAERFETDHTSRTVSAADVRSELDDIVAAMDQPTIDGVNTYFVSKVAAEAGLKVVLSGLGSDELLFGYPSFETVPQRYRAASLLYRLPGGVRRGVASLVEQVGDLAPSLPAGKVADAIGSDAPFGAAYLSVRGIFSSASRESLLEPPPTDWAAAIQRDVEETLTLDERSAVSRTELFWYMHSQLLRDTDAMSMSHSLEVRVPFLDSEFTEYVMGASAPSKAPGEKQLLKDAVDDVVPEVVLDREKTGFTFPFADWLRDDLDDVVDEALAPARLDQTPLEPAAVARLRRAYDRGDAHWSQLWAIVVLSLWVDEHLPPH
ncbi:asparagine synthase (glutamine-hydrolyzing) [Halorarius litoreus]|uniref:asparagine synthase (glutamine-hydrolyzing) n=1 Tax=Halorarius litoreus TaxID=2962676 RepID=UPI0020CF1C7F|nr:asparagine synthase (glutamine-hydrolyzing) [Halorarius litoreus]